MATIVELPRLSDTMEEGVIAKWHIAEGDKVKRGQVIADIETDKATMEYESFDAGTVLKIVASEGDTHPIGTPIAVLGKPGEDFEEALAGAGGGSKAKAEPEPQEEPESTEEPEPESTEEPESTQEPEPEPAAPSSDADDRVAASPLARRLAHEAGIALSTIEGSGPHGRVIKADVDAAIEGGGGGGTGTVSDGERTFVTRPDTPMKLSQMRKTIARRMGESNAEIPHFYLTIDLDMAGAVAMRTQLKAALPDVKISYNDMVILAVAKALQKHPEVNAYWDGKTIVRRGDIHVGMAVAVDEGLIVPPVRHTEQRTLSEVAGITRSLGTRARDKKLPPDEMTGSTFTVSNLGMFGIEQFLAVINPGEGAILAVGAIRDEAVVVDGALQPGKRMRVNLACDHRVMDGAVGAQFLVTLRGYLEQPLAMLA
ncbi:MAG: dihydrolipoamide acetyltransferase family protein [Nannocystaceae bacterium]|nr:2-oxo acid dehydrogenase subunit E2 [bacterium]